VVTVLLATTRIDSGRLKMSVRIGAEPGVGIGRRKSNRIEAINLTPIGDAVSGSIEIGPIPAHPLAAYSWLCIATVAQQLLHSTRLAT
jgi:hypothetical protein